MYRIKITKKQNDTFNKIALVKIALVLMFSCVFYQAAEMSLTTNYQVRAYDQVTDTSSKKTEKKTEPINVKVNFQQNYKTYYSNSDQNTRKFLITRYLESAGYSKTDIETFLKIGQLESGLQLDSVPPVFVKHCKRANGTYYVVEINKQGRQDYCRTGDVEVHQERSYGIFQILPSTAKDYKCNKDLTTLEGQLDCAIKLQKSSKGWNHWSTYQKIK